MRRLTYATVMIALLGTPQFASAAEDCPEQPHYDVLAAMTISELVDQYCLNDTHPDCADAQTVLLHMLDVGHGLAGPICNKPRLDPVGRLTREICGPWQLHGYRVGMSEADALARRPTKKARDLFEIQKFEGFKGTLDIDRLGLATYRSTIDRKLATPEFTRELEFSLSAHFGEPYISNLDDEGQRLPGNTLLWKSSDCNAIIGLETRTGKKGQPQASLILLQRLSLFKAAVRKQSPGRARLPKY